MEVQIPIDPVTLEGELVVPPGASGLVVFAHGSGSGRFSPRNRFVAEVFRTAGLGTLLVDLLTGEEGGADARTMALRFDVPALADRLVALVDWLQSQPQTRGLPVGLFGSSTGAGAALVAAAERPERVAAVVSRGGRPDLAGDALRRVRAPTLLIVGGRDSRVVLLNRGARFLLGRSSRLEVVPGAGHLFEESGALEEVARMAAEWFATHLKTPVATAAGETAQSAGAHPIPGAIRE
jgi:putative phosphoribosyl transferase